MANQPIQYPNIDLPGAEYFALAPNRTVAIQGMRRQSLTTGANAIPPGTGSQIGNALQLETGFTLTSAIYIRKSDCLFTPTDGSGEIQVTGLRMALGFASAELAFDLGYPAITTPTPKIESLVLTDRELFITARDILIGSAGFTGNLWITSFVGVVNNDSTNTHNATTTLRIYYSRLDGVTE